MSDLIDRKALVEDIEATVRFSVRTSPSPEVKGAQKVIERINKARTVDAVEVVRCKDCRFYEIGKSYTPYCNNVMNLFEEMRPDDFCSYGERRTE